MNLSFQLSLLSIITQPSRCSKSHILLLNQCRTVIEPLQQSYRAISTAINYHTLETQVIIISIPASLLHVVRRVTSHFSINAEQLSSHSNNKSSSFQYLLSQSFSPEQKNAFDTLSSSAAINQTNVIAMSSQSSTGSSVVLSPTALPYLDASTQNMTILFNGS
ncbi:hypothetical protein GmHk_13G037775 [Glycine max]|nr:hypothetical protein GmHk_13G037775 [Glycine max]